MDDRRDSCAVIIDFGEEHAKAAAAREVADVLQAYRAGVVPFAAFLAALVAPFNGDQPGGGAAGSRLLAARRA
jgi:hypothetical protein